LQRRHLVLALVLAATVTLSGCLAAADDLVDDEYLGFGSDDSAGTASTVPDTGTTALEATDEPLWDNPQTFPHPDFDYPTVTNPPQGEDIPEHWEPIPERQLPTDPADVTHEAGIGDPVPGTGIALFGSLAIVPNRDGQSKIFDISEPTSPELLATFDTPGRDVDTIAYPDGRLVAVFATDQGVDPVWNITDPTNPKRITKLEPTDGSHNVAVVPGTPIMYNGNSGGGGTPTASASPDQGEGITEIYDLSDPDNITHVEDWQNGYGCHDISFRVTEETQRAYCAGIEYTQIWDISDPKNPEVIVSIPVHHGNAGAPSGSVSFARFAHLAIASPDGETLVVGDETGGGLAPACDAYANAGGQTVSGPVGNLYFYDISDEEDPQLQGFMSPSQHYPTNPPDNRVGGFPTACTSHFGRMIPSEEGQHLAMSWYGAGVTLIDFTDPANPVIESQWNQDAETWDVWYYNGYLFTGDQLRGMDVFTLE
jgi:hypothetical protein